MLQRRIEEMKAEEDLPLVVLPETMLPRQRLNVDTWSWLAGALGNNTRVGLLSRASPTLGVEAVLADDGATLVGQRVFMRTEAGEAGASIGDALTTRVRYLDLDLADAMDGARTQSRAVSLIAGELGPLLERWLDLLAEQAEGAGGAAVQRELAALGDLPGVDRPSERALFCAALLNPFGCRDGDASRWPALEIRSVVLTAPSAAQRLAAAKTGLVDSIYKLKGGKWPMNAYYW